MTAHNEFSRARPGRDTCRKGRVRIRRSARRRARSRVTICDWRGSAPGALGLAVWRFCCPRRTGGACAVAGYRYSCVSPGSSPNPGVGALGAELGYPRALSCSEASAARSRGDEVARSASWPDHGHLAVGQAPEPGLLACGGPCGRPGRDWAARSRRCGLASRGHAGMSRRRRVPAMPGPGSGNIRTSAVPQVGQRLHCAMFSQVAGGERGGAACTWRPGPAPGRLLIFTQHRGAPAPGPSKRFPARE